MPRRAGPSRNPAEDVHTAVRELLTRAVERLDQVAAPPAGDDTAVHDVRKRGKEARALALLLGEPGGKRAKRFDSAVRDAGRAVSSLRDAQAVTATLDGLATSTTGSAHAAVTRVRDAERHIGRATLEPPADANADATVAVDRLAVAIAELDRWRPGPGFDPLAEGIERAYRSGRRSLTTLRTTPDDEHMHEWRKDVKRLWYQTRAVRHLAPSALGPMVAVLDELSDLLGDDHDLAVVVERITAAPRAHGGVRAVAGTVTAARSRQSELRARSMRLGATLFAERPGAFRRRLEAYRALTSELGPEPTDSG